MAVAGRADYGPFGEIVQQTGVARELPFGSSTKYTDKETGLNYYGFRYYNPSTGRWPSRDPIGERGGIGLYAINKNDTINYYDFLGLAKSYEGCFTAQQKQTLREAEAEAKRSLGMEINKLNSLDVLSLFLANGTIAKAVPLGSTHFKAQIDAFTRGALSHLKAIHGELAGDTFVLLCGSTGENKKRCEAGNGPLGKAMAYSANSSGGNAFGKRVVVICDPFYGQSLKSSAGTIAHELSHAHPELQSRHRRDIASRRTLLNMGTWPAYTEFPEEVVGNGIEATIGIAVMDLEIKLGLIAP